MLPYAIVTAGTCYCDQPDCGGGCSPKPSCWSNARRIGPQEYAENDCAYCLHLPTCSARLGRTAQPDWGALGIDDPRGRN